MQIREHVHDDRDLEGHGTGCGCDRHACVRLRRDRRQLRWDRHVPDPKRSRWTGHRRNGTPVDDASNWGETLRIFEVELHRNGKVITSGHGHDVLGGPIQALRFLVQELARHPTSRQLRPGEVVTTGTLTQAMPASPGETWATVLTGIDIKGLRARFE